MTTVSVLLSTYNGEKYLKEQIESLLNQTGVEVQIFVRDDGSNDSTIEMLMRYEREGIITLYHGLNYGYGKSFMTLLKTIPKNSDFYAFCDQDDVWKPDKLQKAVACINEKNLEKGQPFLYCALPQYVDQNLEVSNGFHSITDDIPFGFVNCKWALVMQLCGLGCTMVWNKPLCEILGKADYTNYCFGHDNLLSILGALAGNVYRSNEKVVLYRQHGRNIGSDKSKERKPIYIIKKKLSRFNNQNAYKIRCFILDQFGDYLKEGNKDLLKLSVNYRKTVKEKWMLIMKRFATGLNSRERLKYFIMVVFNRY